MKNLCTRIALLVLCGLGSATLDAGQGKHTTVGAIRWDAWWGNSKEEQYLAAKEWQDRLPFYAKIISDKEVQIRDNTQEIVDEEISLAASAGLDYWAFCYYHPKIKNMTQYGDPLRLYLESARKKQINFSLILLLPAMGPYLDGKPKFKEDWENTVSTLTAYFKEETYQKVLGGRPLIYIFYLEKLDQYFGSTADLRKSLDQLRQKTVESGLPSPYIVGMVLWGSENAEYLDGLALDAVSSYSAVDGGREHEELSYKELARQNKEFWDNCKGAGRKVVPTVNAGWDGRPRLIDSTHAQQYKGPWFAKPQPEELSANLTSAFNWLKKNPETAESNTVIIYAWNETSEGGWLVPTQSEGNSRLDAVGKAIKSERQGAGKK